MTNAYAQDPNFIDLFLSEDFNYISSMRLYSIQAAILGLGHVAGFPTTRSIDTQKSTVIDNRVEVVMRKNGTIAGQSNEQNNRSART